MSNKKVRAIAFYLPQFYPTPENDEWWEPGFTEWTNVARAKPLFKGHYQPRIPRDLGFYDLRVPETREKQAQLAREAGIEGFCYWHYWLGNGKRLLDQVFREVVESGKPDFPFCLCWANHSWYKKTWDPTKPNTLLVEQTYPGVEDYTAHFMEMLPAFKDKRYMKINGKLIFGIFAPLEFDIVIFSNTWENLARKYGLEGFHFFAFSHGMYTINNINANLYDSIVLDPMLGMFDDIWVSKEVPSDRKKKLSKEKPHYILYEDYVKGALNVFDEYPLVYPCLDPNYDHAPRSGYRAHILHGSTPQKWAELYKRTIERYSFRPYEENLLFIKAWNEWGEGNYLEPDRMWGKGYIEEMHKIMEDL